MALNNLRIIYNNLVDLSTTSITASSTLSTSTPVTNMAKDAKGSVWRSSTATNSSMTITTAATLNSATLTSAALFGATTTGVTVGSIITGAGIPAGTTVTAKASSSSLTMSNVATATGSSSRVFTINLKVRLLVDLGSAQSIGGIILPFTNLASNLANITITGYSAAPTFAGTVDVPTVSGGTTVAGFLSTANLCCPWNTLGLPNWGTNPSGANVYAYGGGTYARVWLSTAIQALQARYILIEINDLGNTSKYIEISRLVIGQYWSPVYNTGYGMTSTIKDLSVNERTQSGDLISQRGPRYNALTFDLKWLDPSDRVQLTKIVLGNGLPRPLLISLFPDNGTTSAQAEMERTHQIYGKMVSLPGITYDMLDIYSTQFDIEEV